MASETWSAYSEPVNRIFEYMRKTATPEEFKQLEAILLPQSVNPKDHDVPWRAAVDVLAKYGLTKEDAGDWIMAARNVRWHPDSVTNTAMPESGAIPSRQFMDPEGVKTSQSFLEKYNSFLQSKNIAAESAAAETAKDQETQKRASLSEQIQQFIDTMTGPSRADDPVRRALVQAGTDAAQMSAGSAGVRGGLANTAAASMVQANLVPYEAQRAQLAQQGLGLLNNRELGIGQLQLGAAQLEQQRALAEQARMDMLAQEQYRAQAGQAQALGGLLGSTFGTIAGSYFGMPQLGSVGGQIGGGIGGLMGPSAPSYTPSGNSNYSQSSANSSYRRPRSNTTYNSGSTS